MEARLHDQQKELKDARDQLAGGQEVGIRMNLANQTAEEYRQKYKKTKLLLKDAEERNRTLKRQQDEREIYFYNIICGLRDRVSA